MVKGQKEEQKGEKLSFGHFSLCFLPPLLRRTFDGVMLW